MNDKKNILLCVTGGIAAYKAAVLTSKLTQAHYDVKVMMSSGAQQFITPLTFQSLSRHDVYTDTFAEKDANVIAHIDLADWADLVIVAPATANIIGKLANGICDDMITTTLLATTAPVWIAPAMNIHMYNHPAVQQNMKILESYGYQLIEPNEGYLACGYVGKGRLEEPETIAEKVHEFFTAKKEQPLKGKKVLITAGPTQEPVDPVRYFTNKSSGKMGYALAEIARDFGAKVTLVSGPTTLEAPAEIEVIHITTAAEMYQEVLSKYDEMDIVIKAAAVADYRPKITYQEKLKKQNDELKIEMERTTDILFALGQRKKHQLLVGFAAETEHVEEHALTKLKKKNLDFIVANNVKQEGAGFGVDTNIVTIYSANGSATQLPLLTKHETAKMIFREILRKG